MVSLIEEYKKLRIAALKEKIDTKMTLILEERNNILEHLKNYPLNSCRIDFNENMSWFKNEGFSVGDSMKYAGWVSIEDNN